MAKDESETSITDLHQALIEAQAAFDAADNEERAASSRRTTALNKLNSAQKAFDAGVEAVRNAAPRDSDWKSRQRMKEV